MIGKPSSYQEIFVYTKGKNDQVDAEWIAQYAARFSDQAQLWQAARAVIEELQGLVRLR